MRNEMSLQDRYEYLVELNEKKEYTKLTGAFLKLFLDTNFKYMPENSEIDFLLNLINEQEYGKFAFHAQKYCLDNDINPEFPEDMETLTEAEASDDIKRDVAYEALTGLINAKNMSNTK